MVAGFFMLAATMAGQKSLAAQDSLTVTTNHYFVTGSSLHEIRRSIDRLRPGGVNGGHDGLTMWKLGWNVRVGSVAGESQVTSFTTSTAITITLPSWRAPTNVAPSVVQAWVSYYSALQKHEWAHATNGMMAAAELRKRVAEIGADSSHVRLQQRVQAVADAVIAEYKQRDVDYDRQTDHGRREGASLP